ncbi:MAG: DUF5721 family protein [Lachnospiraceae bacterium]|nr:hypothetical protein [Lachnospiraceae bacterium]MEE1015411.1 DUF5721 family protein [Lachnospiraceae bacterium]
MIALQIQEIKNFMSKLLLSQTFDAFHLIEGSITTYNTFHIDGRIHKDFFTEEEIEERKLNDREFSLWKEVKPFCLELIKGKKTPLGFKFVFQLSKENTEKLLTSSGITSIRPENVSGLLLNVRYDNGTLSCITATNLNLFTLDKSLEHAWDDMVKRFFKQQEISFL